MWNKESFTVDARDDIIICLCCFTISGNGGAVSRAQTQSPDHSDIENSVRQAATRVQISRRMMRIMMIISPFGQCGCGRPLRGMRCIHINQIHSCGHPFARIEAPSLEFYGQ